MEELLIALLAGVASGRRYWDEAPQDLDPKQGAYVVLHRIGGPRSYTFQGADSLAPIRVQANCIAPTTTAATATARDLVQVLSGYRSGPILGIFIDNDGRTLSQSDAGEVNRLRGRAVDFVVHYRS